VKVTSDGKSGLFLFLFCAFLFLIVIPFSVEQGSARLMPNLSVVWMAVFSALLAFSGIRTAPPHERGEEGALIDKADLGHGESRVVIQLFLVWGVHIFLLPLLGFYLGSFLALGLSAYILGKRPIGSVIAWSTFPLLGMYLLFETVLQLKLPKGKSVIMLISAFTGS
jgi:hypothetical protein